MDADCFGLAESTAVVLVCVLTQDRLAGVGSGCDLDSDRSAACVGGGQGRRTVPDSGQLGGDSGGCTYRPGLLVTGVLCCQQTGTSSATRHVMIIFISPRTLNR